MIEQAGNEKTSRYRGSVQITQPIFIFRGIYEKSRGFG